MSRLVLSLKERKRDTFSIWIFRPQSIDLPNKPPNTISDPDPPEVEVLESRQEYHPTLKQRQLSVGCNVTADPSPDVNWMRGRLVLSTHDTKVEVMMISR